MLTVKEITMLRVAMIQALSHCKEHNPGLYPEKRAAYEPLFAKLWDMREALETK